MALLFLNVIVTLGGMGSLDMPPLAENSLKLCDSCTCMYYARKISRESPDPNSLRVVVMQRCESEGLACETTIQYSNLIGYFKGARNSNSLIFMSVAKT
jgi:hypothetical protein